jgi:hypothetical protein
VQTPYQANANASGDSVTRSSTSIPGRPGRGLTVARDSADCSATTNVLRDRSAELWTGDEPMFLSAR